MYLQFAGFFFLLVLVQTQILQIKTKENKTEIQRNQASGLRL